MRATTVRNIGTVRTSLIKNNSAANTSSVRTSSARNGSNNKFNEQHQHSKNAVPRALGVYSHLFSARKEGRREGRKVVEGRKEGGGRKLKEGS